jgi:hypothetical protein
VYISHSARSVLPTVNLIACDTVLHICEVIKLSHSEIIFFYFTQNRFVVAATPCCSEACYLVGTAAAEDVSRYLQTGVLLNIKI